MRVGGLHFWWGGARFEFGGGEARCWREGVLDFERGELNLAWGA